MGRMSKHKAGKAAVTKRRKKSGSSSASTTTVSTTNSSSGGGSGARRTPASLAESIALANAGGASPTGSTGTAGSSTPSSSSSAKECEQCGNPTMLDGVSASRTWTTSKKQLAANGCQICDFVTYRKSQRPCVHCERAACEHFCEWCGNGYHTKCARVRDEKVHAPNGFCCRKCEAEQADDDDTSGAKDAEAEEIGARCGSCRLPFNASGRDDGANSEEEETKGPEPAEESGFKVNQSVLVENEEVLYNAVITDVDLKGERIKIHFIRWSKSFDNWYAMDDERINESLACDCCNHWFHIGCLPPIKSSGRFKDTTYVCPTCIDDAKHFHNGTRPKAKAALASSSSSSLGASNSRTRKSSVSEDAPAAPAKRKSTKPIVTSDDEQDVVAVAAVKKLSDRSKKKRKLSVSSDSPAKKPELSRAASRSKSPETVAPTRADTPTADDAAMEDDGDDESGAASADAPSSPAHSSSAVEARASPAASPRAAASEESAATPTTRDGDTTNDDSAPVEPSEKPNATTDSGDSSSSSSSSSSGGAENDPTAGDASTIDAPPKDAKAALGARRKASSHSVSSLLNSPSPNEKPATPPLHPHMAPLSMLDENRRSLTASFDVLVKTERNHQLPPLPSSSSANGRGSSSSSSSSSKTGSAKIEPYQSPSRSNWPARAPPASASGNKPASSSSRSSLSAFDILRQVATQSIGGELDVAPVKPKKERQRASAAKAKAMKAEKAAAAAAADKTGAKTSSSSSGPGGAAASEQERLFQSKERVHLNSFVDLHFSIRKEMYLKFCGLEEQGLLDRDTAQLLRSLIYPTSERFQDLKFVYLVNKDLSPLYLTKRLLEVVPAALGGTGVAAPPAKSQQQPAGASTPGGGSSSRAGSVASSPASTNHTAQPVPTIVPPGLTIPSFSEIIASEKAAALLQQQQQRQHLQLQQHLQQQHQTLQAAALATSTALELRKKAAALRPDAIAKELAPLPSASAVTSAVSAAASAVSAALSSSVVASLTPSSTLSSSAMAPAAGPSPSVQSDTLLSRS